MLGIRLARPREEQEGLSDEEGEGEGQYAHHAEVELVDLCGIYGPRLISHARNSMCTLTPIFLRSSNCRLFPQMDPRYHWTSSYN
jgi:hypothetical protein